MESIKVMVELVRAFGKALLLALWLFRSISSYLFAIHQFSCCCCSGNKHALFSYYCRYL